MPGQLVELDVQNFRSLRDVAIPLGRLNVLVGPNGAGKTNVLEVFRFLADVIRLDLEPALRVHGGFDQILFGGGPAPCADLGIALTVANSSRGSDRYALRLDQIKGPKFRRSESFEFHSDGHPPRAITLDDTSLVATGIGDNRINVERLTSGLSTIPRLGEEFGRAEVGALSRRLESVRFFDIDVSKALLPSGVPGDEPVALAADAGNLAGFLLALSKSDRESWELLVEDARNVLPQLDDIDFEFPSGAGREVIVTLKERGLRRPTPLVNASYGTIRLLSLLALVYDTNPPALTCIEEVDHRLHPQALELLVARLREASARTQFLVATHSPTLADRLRPEELIICERRDDGSSAILAEVNGCRQINPLRTSRDGTSQGADRGRGARSPASAGLRCG